jgi:Leucine-rich repeat (LRR) protein
VDGLGFVTELHLFGQQFIPRSIFCFTKLKSLSIANSNFYIPAEIARLSSTLETLRISNLNTPLNILPAELFMLSSLKTLQLTYCGIEILPDDIAKLTLLNTLDLRGNKLVDSLPNSIKELKYLTKLDVSNNPFITSLDVLDQSTCLGELRASHCGLIHIPRYWCRLSILDLSHNKLTSLVDIESTFSYPLSVHPYKRKSYFWFESCERSQLRDLDVSNNKIFTVPEELYHFNYLKRLNLQNNQFSNQEIEWIVGRFRPSGYSRSVVII